MSLLDSANPINLSSTTSVEFEHEIPLSVIGEALGKTAYTIQYDQVSILIHAVRRILTENQERVTYMDHTSWLIPIHFK